MFRENSRLEVIHNYHSYEAFRNTIHNCKTSIISAHFERLQIFHTETPRCALEFK